jgi:hypothetical protein
VKTKGRIYGYKKEQENRKYRKLHKKKSLMIYCLQKYCKNDYVKDIKTGWTCRKDRETLFLHISLPTKAVS